MKDLKNLYDNMWSGQKLINSSAVKKLKNQNMEIVSDKTLKLKSHTIVTWFSW